LQIDSCLAGQEIKEPTAHFRLWRIKPLSSSPQSPNFLQHLSKIHFNIMLKTLTVLVTKFAILAVKALVNFVTCVVTNIRVQERTVPAPFARF
jgi:hypothetical protein